SSQVLQLSQKIGAPHPGVRNQVFFLDDSQVMRRADVISEVAAPGRADAARQAKAVVFDFIQPRARHHAANLDLLSEDQQVGQNAGMFAAPPLARNARAALYFVENEQHVALITNLAQGLEEFAPEMIVPALALDR